MLREIAYGIEVATISIILGITKAIIVVKNWWCKNMVDAT